MNNLRGVLEIKIGLVKGQDDNKLYYEIEIIFEDGSMVNKTTPASKLVVLDFTEGMAEA